MNKRTLSLLVDNTPGLLSRVSGLFTRRGYNIVSITAGVTTDPAYTRITIVTEGDEDIIEQIVGDIDDEYDEVEFDYLDTAAAHDVDGVSRFHRSTDEDDFNPA